MVILGLGANLGDRLTNLRNALAAIRQIPGTQVLQVSPVYQSDALLPENAPADWDRPYLNLALRCETSLTPLALLQSLKKIEWSIGRKPEVRHWGPRVMDIDILAWDDQIIHSETLTVPHESLLARPFALWPLADVAPRWMYPLEGTHHGKIAAEIVEGWGSRYDGKSPFHTHQLNHRVDTPHLVGIINVTPDSFSDGGQFVTAESAVEQALHLIQAGAEIIDIGAESTAPRAAPLDPVTEWTRLQRILTAINASQHRFVIPPRISVDTRHPETAEKALAMGADWINDVTGLSHPAMRTLLAGSKADCVIMHHTTIPASRDQVLPRGIDAVSQVYDWGARQIEKLERDGIARERIIFDPGIGFGKAAEQSLDIIKQAAVYQRLGARLLVGHSRKSFLSILTPYDAPARDVETLVISLFLAKLPVDYLRVHDVEMCSRGFRIAAALTA